MSNYNLEDDLLKSKNIIDKCKKSKSYAQNLYAAMCNTTFFKDGQEWSCSWRHSGSIVAAILGEGCYMDWYCSGMATNNLEGYVEESRVTQEIAKDLLELGWSYKVDENI